MGVQIRLSDFIGQRVALCFYPMGGTYGCNQQHVAFEMIGMKSKTQL